MTLRPQSYATRGTRSCETCGETFEVKPTGVIGRYCSDHCRKASYARPCPDCGEKMSGCWGRGSRAPGFCAACKARRQHDDRYWTRERVLAALNTWPETMRPSAQDWLTGGRPEGMPNVTTIQNECGSWSAAWDELGYAQRPRGWRAHKAQMGRAA